MVMAKASTVAICDLKNAARRRDGVLPFAVGGAGTLPAGDFRHWRRRRYRRGAVSRGERLPLAGEAVQAGDLVVDPSGHADVAHRFERGRHVADAAVRATRGSRRAATMRRLANPSTRVSHRRNERCQRSVVSTRTNVRTMRSGSVPTIRAQPHATASGRSVRSRSTSTGFLKAGASS